METAQVKNQRPGLPRYYVVTALAVVMLLAAAGGLIAYRLSLDALAERASGENAVFARSIEQLARRTALGMNTAEKLEERIGAEMDRRPVVKVVVYDEMWRIRFSTNPDEVGALFPAEDHFFDYNRQGGELTRHATFDTGTEILQARDMVITQVSVSQESWYQAPGIILYTDVTDERLRIIRTDALIVGAIELALAVILLRRA